MGRGDDARGRVEREPDIDVGAVAVLREGEDGQGGVGAGIVVVVVIVAATLPTTSVPGPLTPIAPPVIVIVVVPFFHEPEIVDGELVSEPGDEDLMLVDGPDVRDGAGCGDDAPPIRWLAVVADPHPSRAATEQEDIGVLGLEVEGEDVGVGVPLLGLRGAPGRQPGPVPVGDPADHPPVCADRTHLVRILGGGCDRIGLVVVMPQVALCIDSSVYGITAFFC